MEQPTNSLGQTRGISNQLNGNSETESLREGSKQRMLADGLMAALAGGDLERLAQTREAFLKEPAPEVHQQTSDLPLEPPPVLISQLERRLTAPPIGKTFGSHDDLREEEAAVSRAEQELERRRGEIQAARKKIEEEIQRRTAEERRLQFEAELERRALLEAQRLTELHALRDKAAEESRQRTQQLEQQRAEIESLRKLAQEQAALIEKTSEEIQTQELSRQQLHADSALVAQRKQELLNEIAGLEENQRIQSEAVTSSQVRIGELEEVLRQLGVEIQTHESTGQQLQAESARASQRKQELLNEIAGLEENQRTQADAATSAQARIVELEEVLRQLGSEVTQLTERQQQLSTEVEQLIQTKTTAQQQVAQKEEELNTQREAHEAELEKCALLETQRLTELQALRDKAAEESRQRTQQLEQQRAEIENLRKLAQEQAALIEKTNEEIQTQEFSRQQLHTDSALVAQRKQELLNEIAGLEENQRIQSEAVTAGQARIAELQVVLRQLGVEIQTHESTGQQLQAESARASQRKQELLNEIAGLEENQRTQADAATSAQARIVELEEVLRQLGSEVTQLTERQQQLSTEVEQLIQTKTTAQQQVAQKEEELNTQREAHELIVARHEELTRSEHEIRSQLAEKEAHLRDTEQAHLTAQLEADAQAADHEQRLEKVATWRDELESVNRTRSQREQTLNEEVNQLRGAEPEQLKRLEELEAIVNGLRENYAQAKARLDSLLEEEQSISAQVEALTRAQAEQLQQIEQGRIDFEAQEAAQQQAAEELRLSYENHEQRLAELRAISTELEAKSRQLTVEEASLKSRIDEQQQRDEEQKRELEEARGLLVVAEETLSQKQTVICEANDQLESLRIEIESLTQSGNEILQIVAQTRNLNLEKKEDLKSMEEQLKLQYQEEQKLDGELEHLRQVEQEHLARLEELKARTPELEKAINKAEAEAELRVEQERQLHIFIDVLVAQEEEQNQRINALQRLAAEHVKSCSITDAQAQQHAEVANEFDSELNWVHRDKEKNQLRRIEDVERNLRKMRDTRMENQISFQERTQKVQELNAEIEALRKSEAEQRTHIEEAENRLRTEEEAHQEIHSRVQELAETEARILGEIATLEKREAEYLDRVREAETRIKAHQEAVSQTLAQVEQKANEEHEQLDRLAVLREKSTEVEQPVAGGQEPKSQIETLPHITMKLGEVTSDPQTLAEPQPAVQFRSENDASWQTIDLESSPSKRADFVQTETIADLAALTHDAVAISSTDYAVVTTSELQSPGNGKAARYEEISERLQSSASSERAAALVDLAESGGYDSFALITKSFDDPSAEVRNAAARALYSLQPNLAESFTQALREASLERRRKIGAAISGSGLAANAISSLTGEGRERTFDAFSILFLMAKAGEVQPLIHAIGKHQDLEVRLTLVKLIALSNQPQVLPALRTMAGRSTLPSDVQTAVMEAIYLISNQSRDLPRNQTA